MGDLIKMFREHSNKLLFLQQILLHVFAFLFFTLFTFYLGDGYYMIGDYKYSLYKMIVIPFFVLEAALLIIHMVVVKERDLMENQFRKEDLFLLAYGTVVFLSALGSCNMTTALRGYQAWFLGLYMMESFFLLYLIFSKSFHYKAFTVWGYLGTGFLMCALGYLQRCGINLLPKQGYDQEGFSLSTLGNINWICGYLAVMYPVFMGVCMEYFKKKKYREHKVVAGMMVLGFQVVTGFLVLQGSESGWLILGVTWLGFFWYACTSKRRVSMDIYLFVMLAAMLGIGLTSKIYWYRITHGVACYYGLNQIMYSGIWFVGAFLCAAWMSIRFAVRHEKGIFANSFFDRFRQEERKYCRWLRNLVFVFLVAVIFFVVNIMIDYQRNPMSHPWVGEHHVLMFDLEWGHGRGAIWRTALLTFRSGGLWRRLFGYGPDCYYFATMMNGNDIYMGAYYDMFSSDIVVNAHNEILNILVNSGIFGLVTYLGFLGCLGYRYYKMSFRVDAKKENVIAFTGLVVILSMSIHNLVSFEQIEATPFFFLLLGIVSSYCKKLEIRKRRTEGNDKTQKTMLHLVKNKNGTRKEKDGRERKI